MILKARAKVNLYLEVVGKRPDGYHDLVTVFDRISLADTVELSAHESPGVAFTCDAPGVPADPSNLAWRGAAAALRAAAGNAGKSRPRGVAVHLRKAVPAGAGLGGGSADAAAALFGTDRLLGLGIPEPQLLSLAREIGADVPFFVHGHLRDAEYPGSGRMAVGKGVGERLSTVKSPPSLFYVLMNPGFEVSTAEVFKAGRWPSGREGDQGGIQAGIEGGIRRFEDVLRLLRNDLEAVTASRHPEIPEMRQTLLRAGARAAQMSGSGPTVFGVFATMEGAKRAGEELETSLTGSKTRVFVAGGE